SRAQTERGGPQQHPPGAARRQRKAQETAQGPRDLRRRREEGPRRGAENHRQPHPEHRRPAEEKGRRTARQVRSKKTFLCPSSPISNAPSRAERRRSIRTSATICARAAPPCSPGTTSRRRVRGPATAWWDATPTCGGIAS